MTATKTARLHIVKIEDHEGDGTCTVCGREGLRWIVTLSDGTQVGTECTKRALGYAITPAKHKWTTAFRPVAEHTDCGSTYVLWEARTGNGTRETRDGHLTVVGGVRQAWAGRGWI